MYLIEGLLGELQNTFGKEEDSMSNEDILKHISRFYAAYELILNKPATFDEIKRAMIIGGMPETSARRYSSDFHYPFCSELLELGDGGTVKINRDGAEQFIGDMAKWFQVEIIPMNVYEEKKEEILKIAKRDSDINMNLTAENHDLYQKLKMQKKATKDEQDKLERLAVYMKNLQDLYDAKSEEMNTLCVSPKKQFKQFMTACIDQHIKKKNRDTQ